jgi:hypothetical protein
MKRKTLPGGLLRDGPCPIIFVIAGAVSVPIVLQMIREALGQTYYGAVIVDVRSQPPIVTSDLKIPGNMVF